MSSKKSPILSSVWYQRLYFICAVLITLLLGCSAAQRELPEPPPPGGVKYGNLQREWEYCEDDSDCVAVHGVCQAWVMINKDAQEAAATYFARVNRLARCIERGKRNAPEPLCLGGRCVASE